MQVLVNNDSDLLVKISSAENSVKKAKAAYQYSLENLRGVFILFVMLSHITSFKSLGWLGKCLWFLFGDATAWFVFISGFLFNYIEQRRFSYNDYLGKKVKFVILPYLILSIPGIAAGLFFQRHLLVGLSPVGYGFWSLLVGGAVIIPMWFIPMIAIFFLLSPLSYRLGKSGSQYIALLVGLSISLFTTRPIDNLNPFLEFAHFAGFYVLGIVISSNYGAISKFNKGMLANWVIVIGVLLFIFAFMINFMGHEDNALGFMDGLGQFNNVQFGKLGLLIAAFLMFDRFLNIPNRTLGWIANISFGLFFMQGFFMAVFFKLNQMVVFSSPVLAVAVEMSLVLGGSMLAVVVIRTLLGKWSRYVIGC